MYTGRAPLIPETIDGTVFISAIEHSGLPWGPGPMNPYETFRHLRPATVLGGAILVYEGHFAIPAVAAVSHLNAANRLATDGQLDQALAEAMTATTLAPGSIAAHAAYSNLLVRDGRFNDARAEYDKAVALAQKIDDPKFRKLYLAALGQETR
jgi:tetratricopeptide (TPR) repeat protein